MKKPSRGLHANAAGFIVNPAAASLFFGLVLTIVVYSALDLSGAMNHLGSYGPLLPLLVIVWLMAGAYIGMKRFKRRATRIRIKGPLFMRLLMNDCLQRTCGLMETRLNTPAISSVMILNDILLDRMLHICATDCLRFSDIRRQIEDSRLKGTSNLVLARFGQTAVEYRKQNLPAEIRQVEDTVLRSRPDLKGLLEQLKHAHQTLFTGTGDLVGLLPPDSKRVARIRTTYRYRPPTPERAQRMAFALETMAYLKATRHENVNPMDRKRYDGVAAQMIPKLADNLNGYKQAWQELVDAFEKPGN
ncbi:hypothetical protein [Desulfosarcina sp.]|uniref:hypothetical protein n=1 Tax=Desulfosarcina sp. TaxID=2027861 RepID=UPI0039708732